MAQNIVTNANDVELILSDPSGAKRGTSRAMGRIVVDDFSITHEEDNTLESGVGQRAPAGFSYGNAEYSFSFTLLGDDKGVFDMVAQTNDGTLLFEPFAVTARKTDDNDNVEWEYALDPALATSEEPSASSGDPMEYAVEGIAVRCDRINNV